MQRTRIYLTLTLSLLAGTVATVPAAIAASASVGDYSVNLGGRLMWDMDSFDDALNPDNDGERRFSTQLRRARLELSGDLPGAFDWVFELSYLDDTNEAEVHAAGLRYTGWKLANVFFGRTKEPFGLEELASSKAISTLRRNFFTDASDVDSQPYYGLVLDGFVGPVGWSAGVFNPSGNPTGDDGGDRLAYTGRLFGAPINDGTRVLHLGAAATDRNLDAAEDLTGFGVRVAETADRIPSASISAREDRQYGLEALYLHGPFSLQAEHFWRDLEGSGSGPDAQVRSYYLQGTWTLTGESRGYKAATGVPDIVKPSGDGAAVELVAKVERIEFDPDQAVDQVGRAYVLGANVYPNRNVKLMLNVSRLTTSRLVAPGEPDDSLAVSARIQVAF